MDEETQERLLRNNTVTLQWAGFDVGFFLLDEPESPDEKEWLLNRLKSRTVLGALVSNKPSFQEESADVSSGL